MAPLRVGFLGYENVNALDIVGPAEAFASAFRENGKGKFERCYEVSIIGLKRRSFAAESGIVFQPTATIETAPKLDTLIIPGGCGLRLPDVNRKAADWILERAKGTRRVASVCTGIYGLAATGLLDGRRVTTHWRFAADVAKRFPKLRMEPNALFVKDGPFYSSAGITAGIDLALALIEEDFGAKMALSVAREMVVYLKRSGGQEQYSEPLQFQTNSSDRFAELVAWMTNNPTKADVGGISRPSRLPLAAAVLPSLQGAFRFIARDVCRNAATERSPAPSFRRAKPRSRAWPNQSASTALIHSAAPSSAGSASRRASIGAALGFHPSSA